MTIERNDIKHLMWRKKVDSSIFNGESVIPMAFVKQWNLKSNFKDNGKNSSYWPVQIKFGSKYYDGKVFYRPPTKARSSEQHKIIFQDDLIEDLKKAFLMSHIRWLEVELRKQDGKKAAEATKETERETPFWEFLDIEFDDSDKFEVIKKNDHSVDAVQYGVRYLNGVDVSSPADRFKVDTKKPTLHDYVTGRA